MVQIFLAHANEDKAEVIKLYDRLQQQGYKPWLDKKDLLGGQSWRAEIPRAIKSSQVFIACLSKQSVAKQGYVQREFRMALQEMANKPVGQIYLIPVRLDDCEIPELRQEEYGINLRDLHWVDLFEPDGFEQLVKSIVHHFPESQESVTSTTTAKAPKTIDLGNGITLELVHIPGGTFLMGAPKSETGSQDSERPQHKVTVPGFWMGKYPVTQEQYEAVMGVRSIYLSSGKPNHPVETVSWHDAVVFCETVEQQTGVAFRLPSEAEWEYACRARTTTPFYFGESINSDQANCWHEHGEKTVPVDKFSANAFGLYDMHGNVLEWCQDYWHENYKGAPTDGTAWTQGNTGAPGARVLRGGSWAFNSEFCRSACRFCYGSSSRDHFIGFRVACSNLVDSLEPTKKTLFADSTEVTKDGEIRNVISAGTF